MQITANSKLLRISLRPLQGGGRSSSSSISSSAAAMLKKEDAAFNTINSSSVHGNGSSISSDADSDDCDSGMCSLLEIGDWRLLLDCGCSPAVLRTSNNSNSSIDQQQQSAYERLHATVVELREQQIFIDAILLSHADVQHAGALPLFLGRNGLLQQQQQQQQEQWQIPIYCTLPVYKFSQIVLYDHFLNQKMDGLDSRLLYDLEDIDAAFRNVITVKYNQTLPVAAAILEQQQQQRPPLTVTALPAGRTIGGAMWRICAGATEILYAVDVHLRRETVLPGMRLDALPSAAAGAPALLICDASSASYSKRNPSPHCISSSSSGTGGVSRGRKTSSVAADSDNAQSLIDLSMQTLRAGGNVLLPCETAARTLELLQLLSRHWLQHKIGMYSLVLLSHMSYNITEFARMQLEWMSDALSRSFYSGGLNPFELPMLHCVRSVQEMEEKCPGPKLVLATDGSLSAGLSKQLLLLWGGDPRCRVIFTDRSPAGSLAAEIRSKYVFPPLLAWISQPTRVEVSGAELLSLRAEKLRRRRLRDEQLQRKRRKQELSSLNVIGVGALIDDDDDNTTAASASAAAATSSTDTSSHTATDVGTIHGNSSGNKKASVAKNPFSRFLEPNFLMFESKQAQLVEDEYGASIDDLNFRDIQSVESKWHLRDRTSGDDRTAAGDAPTTSAATSIATSNSSRKRSAAVLTAATAADDDSTDDETGSSSDFSDAEESVPTKLVPSFTRVQFTCEFKELNLSGRSDFKAMKTLITKLAPARLLLLTAGCRADGELLLRFAAANQMLGFAPSNHSAATTVGVVAATTFSAAVASAVAAVEAGAVVNFSVHAEKLKIQIPHTLLPVNMCTVRTYSAPAAATSIASSAAAGSMLVDSKCSVASLRGVVEESFSSATREGTRIVKYRGPAPAATSATPTGAAAITTATITSTAEGKEPNADQQQQQTEHTEEQEEGYKEEERVHVVDRGIGVVSAGEVTLQSLRHLIEAGGTAVESRISAQYGAVLLCGGSTAASMGGQQQQQQQQVLLRKHSNGSDFVIEGPPVPAYYEVRKALYLQFAFV